MRKTSLFLRLAALAVTCCMAASAASAEPGDAKAVAKARKDYTEAMRGHDVGLQNAMRVELTYQLSKAKERARHRGAPSGAQAPGNPAN